MAAELESYLLPRYQLERRKPLAYSRLAESGEAPLDSAGSGIGFAAKSIAQAARRFHIGPIV